MTSDEKGLTRAGAIRALVDLERRRIDRDNRQAEVELRALEFANGQDERQFEYHSRDQDLRAEGERTHFKFVRLTIWALLASILVAAGLMFYMAFLGNEVQRAMAVNVAKSVPIALAGWAIISGLFKLLQVIVRRSP